MEEQTIGTRDVGVWVFKIPLCNPFNCCSFERWHASISRTMSDSSSMAGVWTAKVASFSNAECLMFVEKLYSSQWKWPWGGEWPDKWIPYSSIIGKRRSAGEPLLEDLWMISSRGLLGNGCSGCKYSVVVVVVVVVVIPLEIDRLH